MCTFENTSVSIEKTMVNLPLNDGETSYIKPDNLIFFALHLLWCVYFKTPQSLTAYIVYNTMNHDRYFWTAVLHEYSPVHLPPEKMYPALNVGRVDLQHFVMKCYAAFIAHGCSLYDINFILTEIENAKFEYCSFSIAWKQAKTWFHQDGVVVAALKTDATKHLPYLVPARKCNIFLNGRPSMAISLTDKYLLAFRHLWDSDSAWVMKGCPENAPSVFSKIEKLVPVLFGKEARESTIFDELPEDPSC